MKTVWRLTLPLLWFGLIATGLVTVTYTLRWPWKTVEVPLTVSDVELAFENVPCEPLYYFSCGGAGDRILFTNECTGEQLESPEWYELHEERHFWRRYRCLEDGESWSRIVWRD